MEVRSFIENVANRATVEDTVARMMRIAMVALFVAAVVLGVATGCHPAAIVIGVVLAVLGVRVARVVRRLAVEHRASPLDVTFDPVAVGGVLSPGVILGTAGGLAAFFGLFAVILWVTSSPDQALLTGGVGLGVAAGVAAFGLPTIGMEERKWTVLRRLLADHPGEVARLQDIRRRFPADAPFAFSAPTDQVSVPEA